MHKFPGEVKQMRCLGDLLKSVGAKFPCAVRGFGIAQPFRPTVQGKQRILGGELVAFHGVHEYRYGGRKYFMG